MNSYCYFKYVESKNNYEGILFDFLNSQQLPELLQGAVEAVLTLLVSFAIGMVIHHLSVSERKNNFLDLRIALDYVWEFKSSVAIILTAVLSPMLLSIGNIYFKCLVFAIWIIALIFLVRIILRLYKWFKGNKDDFRKKYLGSFTKSPEDQVASWSDLWSTDLHKEKQFLERDYFIIFTNQVDLLIASSSEKDWDTFSKLLDSYASNLELRNKTFILFFDEFFPKILEWHKALWLKQYSEFSKDKTEPRQVPRHLIFNVEKTVGKIIKYVTKQKIVGTNGDAFSYFKSLENHINKYRGLSINGVQHNYIYIEHIPIYKDLLNLIPTSPDADNIWRHYFPDDWKITKENFEKNTITRIWYGQFVNWSQEKIWKDSTEWNKELEEVSKELFPSVDPITWAKIYTFALSGQSDSRVKRIIEKGVNFGYAGRVYSGFGDDFEKHFAAMYEAEIDATFDLALFLFRKIYIEKNLNDWLREIDSLNYPENSDEFRRKEVWKGIFLKLLEKIKKQQYQ